MFDLIPFEHRNGGLFDSFDRWMDDSFFSGLDKDFAPCRTDIIDQGDKYLLRADMPGFKKEDININIQGDQLTVSAEHKEETKNDGKNYIRRERRYGALSRSFDIEGIDSGKISASYNNGVLELQLPKVVDTKPEAKKIEIQ
ncbi:MAG: Hsp20/alpha crystallin family protein [Oscillospiraceae bacterium]|jgi:HSP20 family protein|nr:Hsp20/alpha crystallin family protein [Oscillospiraceae bacterium]MCI1991311.1 Hsp20/alpha crystallin family protein [Oscillospiraceae bacterium]MCI2035235.1 Hsp20/alpha crystallin family protein [Oscillospiraceae bacterium]